MLKLFQEGGEAGLDIFVCFKYNHCMETKAFNIVLPQKLVQKIDQVAKQEYRNRSEMIREVLRLYLEEKEGLVLDFTDSLEAEKAKNEPKRLFGSYLQKRWGRKDL